MSKTTTTPTPIAELPAGYADESSPFYVPAPLRDTYQTLSDDAVYPVGDPNLSDAVRPYTRKLAEDSLAERGVVRPDRSRVEDRPAPQTLPDGSWRVISPSQSEAASYGEDFTEWHRKVTEEERKLSRTDLSRRFAFHVWRLDTASRIVRQRADREAIEAAARVVCPICGKVSDRDDITNRPLVPNTTPNENRSAGWVACCTDCYLVVVAEQTAHAATPSRVMAVRKALAGRMGAAA